MTDTSEADGAGAQVAVPETALYGPPRPGDPVAEGRGRWGVAKW